MAKVRKNSGFFNQASIIGKALSDAKKPASTNDAVHQAIRNGKRKLKPKKQETAMMSFLFLTTGR